MIEIAFRSSDKSAPFPQQPKLRKPDVKGFAKAAPWHCKPWVDAQTLGVELSWPWNYTQIVKNVDGEVLVERHWANGHVDEGKGISLFAEGHYGTSSMHQLLMPEGYNGLILPHPRSQTDQDVPAIIPGVLEMDWWPHIFFVVSHIPKPGAQHVYAAGQPFCQVVPVPRVDVEVRQMSAEETRIWDDRERFLDEHRYKISTHNWKTDSGDWFNNRYKTVPKLLKKIGWDGLMEKFREK